MKNIGRCKLLPVTVYVPPSVQKAIYEFGVHSEYVVQQNELSFTINACYRPG